MVVDAFRTLGSKPGRWGARSVVLDMEEGNGEGTFS
jgi:hypothetical protein